MQKGKRIIAAAAAAVLVVTGIALPVSSRTVLAAEAEIVTAAVYPGQTPELPEKVTVTTEAGISEEPVTWNLEGVGFDADPFKYVTVTGAIEGSDIQATAQVQIIPENLEYMIDCNNVQSETWANAVALGADLLNAEAADQKKTGTNNWGYSSSVGASGDSVDMTGYGQSDISNPYKGGWWAHAGANITYKLTLPAGEHQILAGCTGWWSMGREMDVYYAVDTGSEKKLFDFDAVKSTETFAQGTITLDHDAVVKIRVKKAASNDPILSWIAVTGKAENETGIKSTFTGTTGAVQFDNNGNRIQAHGGQVQELTVDGVTKYYWYGEDRSRGYRPVTGVHLYTSEDLYNWTDEGIVFRSIPVSDEEYGKSGTNFAIFTEDEYFQTLYGDYEGQPSDTPDLYESKLEETYWNLAEDRCVIERPKVIYNETTGKYVMWFHADGYTPKNSSNNYGKAQAGVAVSDTPYGPFKLLGTYDLYYSEKTDYEALDDHPGAVRDMNLFVDQDGTAYISYSSEMNRTTYVGKLNDSYTGLSTDPDEAVEGVDYTRNFIGQSREASAMFLYDGTYYMITSGCTGWYPNQAQYAIADTPLGPWTVKGDPCIGDTSGTTFDTQSTCVIPVDAENGKYIYMGDRWYNSGVNGGELSDSRYVWLPVEFGTDNRIALRDYNDWTLEELGGKDNLLINGGFEKGMSTWNSDSAASIGNTDAPEGLQYCVENGNGISQYIMVAPNTEYILTGTAKPGEGALFWIGAKVDGREIYTVLTQDSSYTDTMDSESKLAYSVIAGVTEWTDFEVRFTTGADTKTVKIYTWLSGGKGYVDNLAVRAASEGEPAEPKPEKKPIQSVSFNSDSLNMIIGKENQLKVIVTPADADGADGIEWSSSDEKVLTVDAKGNIKALWPGEAVVTAKAGDKSDSIKVTVYGVEKLYNDVTNGDWFYNAANWAYVNEVMSGYGNNTFGPADTLARAQFAVILYRIAGEPEVKFESRFPDVTENDWFADAVIWANDNEIITGYTATGTFGPADNITREQIATILYRYAKSEEYDVNASDDLADFPDAEKVSGFAEDAVKWAVAKGLIKGDNGNLNPQGNTNRAQAAIIIQRFCEAYEK